MYLPARRYIIDAEGQTLGRVASLAAFYIRGKHMPSYSPSMNMGGYGEPAARQLPGSCGRTRTPVAPQDLRCPTAPAAPLPAQRLPRSARPPPRPRPCPAQW